MTPKTQPRLSVLEVPTLQQGRTARESLDGIVDVAKLAEQAGYHRIWYAEHHKSALLADFSPPVLVTQVAAATETIRVGSGGVMAPNHSPLVIAEQFGTIASLHPERIDVGVGRGPGTMDPSAIDALSRGATPRTADPEFREDVAAILRYCSERTESPEPWLLASSAAGAAIAAKLGLPMTFAYHLRPENTARAIELYKQNFIPSPWCETPYVMLSVSTICAGTMREAEKLARPYDIAMVSVRSGKGEPALLTGEAAAAHVLTSEEEDILGEEFKYQVRGTPETVARGLHDVAASLQADELMLVTPIHDPTDRARSLALTAAPAMATSAVKTG